MDNLFWEFFEKSGNIDAFLAYREFRSNGECDDEYNKDKRHYNS